MHDFSIVAVLQGQTDLSEVVQYLLFIEQLPIALLLDDFVRQLPIVCVLHHKVQVELFVLEDVLELDNVRMIENLQDSRLFPSFDPLLVL